MPRFTRSTAWVPALLLLGVIAAPRAALVEVSIQGFAFSPAAVTVQVGDTVRWTNNDGATHDVVRTEAPGTWNSGNLGNGATYERVFDTPGVFAYVCSHHGGMTGTVTVEGPSSLRYGARAPDANRLPGKGAPRDLLGRSLSPERNAAPVIIVPVR